MNIEMYYNTTSASSGANFVAIRDIIMNTKFSDAVFGVRYYNTGDLFAKYLDSSDFVNYYLSQGYLSGKYTSVAMVGLFYSFGIIGLLVIFFLVKKMFRLSREVQFSIIVIVSFLLQIIQESHALDELYFILFLFGLFWGMDWRSTEKMSVLKFDVKLNGA